MAPTNILLANGGGALNLAAKQAIHEARLADAGRPEQYHGGSWRDARAKFRKAFSGLRAHQLCIDKAKATRQLLDSFVAPRAQVGFVDHDHRGDSTLASH
jgi:hypothetical protein